MRCHECNERLPLSARTCYACGAGVRREDEPADAAMVVVPGKLRVLTSTATLRDRPFSAARPVVKLARGQILTVHGEQWAFIHAETEDGLRGFVERGTVEPLTQPAAPAAHGANQAAPAANGIHEAAPAPNGVHGPATLAANSVAKAVTPDAGEPPVTPVIRHKRIPIADAKVEAKPDEPVPAPKRGPRKRQAQTAALVVEQPDTAPESQPMDESLPFNIPLLEGERVRYRGVFLYNPLEEQMLVVTSRRVIVTGGTYGSLPRVVHLDEVETVLLQDSGTGSTNGEGNLCITLTGLAYPVRVGGIHNPHIVRDEILTACGDRAGGLHTSAGAGSGRRRAKV